ncbi:MAG: VWA domain-containing protein [Deltaproteobacteria bacterium]|nr:VWA domain-containing protein [Deltaproteobacteria bacterium]
MKSPKKQTDFDIFLEEYKFPSAVFFWENRELFSNALEFLFREGWIGGRRHESTKLMFAFLSLAGDKWFDLVLKEFVFAINPKTLWIMDTPGLFGDVIETGRLFGKLKLKYGTTYFQLFGEGAFGDKQEHVYFLLTHLNRLKKIDEELAFAFLNGFRHLMEWLDPNYIDLFIQEGLNLYTNNKRAAYGFMRCTTKNAEDLILDLTRECRLSEIRPTLETMLGALAGYEVKVSSLEELEAEFLEARGTRMVCMYKRLYLPPSIRSFDSKQMNRNRYMLMSVVAAAMLAENSFSSIHGHPEYSNCLDLVGGNLLRLNLFQIIEYTRILGWIKKRWPGAVNMLNWGLKNEFYHMQPVTDADKLFYNLIVPDAALTTVAERVQHIADESINVFDTASRISEDCAIDLSAYGSDSQLSEDLINDLENAYPDIGKYPLRAFSFLPDFLYPGKVDIPSSDKHVENLRRKAKKKKKYYSDESDGYRPKTMHKINQLGGGAEEERKKDESGSSMVSAFLYDEWSQADDDYYINHCFVFEKKPEVKSTRSLKRDLKKEILQTRRLFERFKPHILRREKFLEDGERINHNLLLDHIVMRRKEPSPKICFYERPRIQKRNLAVLILLDVSGSTNEKVGDERVIDIEKHAAMILCEGLASLGDQFSVCGFSSNGREQCNYLIFKDFTDQWDKKSTNRLLSAYPSNATRIGVALRHAGYRLSQIEAKQRLIIVITDGRPMDSGYIPETRYAQFDVRKACDENYRKGLHTFAITTNENSLSDMELMFPKRGFAILSDIRNLPKILPKLYLRLTV